MKKLSRRQVVLGLGAAGTGALLPLAGTPESNAIPSPEPWPSCTLTPEQTEGPFYFETRLIRRDITEGRPGTPLRLKLKVVEAGSCAPIPGAVVDIWSCDAHGEYSGYESANTDFGPPAGQRRPPGPPPDGRGGQPNFRQEPVNEKTFLRGAQVTDAAGEVEFQTIYPGWYPGRATHIHLKVYLGNNEMLTSQMYFPEEHNDRVYAGGVYADHAGQRLRNERDNIFNGAGKGPLVALTNTNEGYVGTLTLGVKRGE
jgi:protocatechuate 3,4-dioxygenase beta subunit